MRRSPRPSGDARPLLLLLAATAVVGACWALIVPPFQAPDEQSHFGYAQTLAERGELPDTEGPRRFSTEQDIAALVVGSDQLAGNLLARPEWSAEAHARWEARQDEVGDDERSDGGGGGPAANPARTNPPLYYAYELIPYWAAYGGDLFDRLYAMRLWSVLLLLVAVAATWALVRELLGRRPLPALAGAAVVAFQPMATFMSASVNPDALLIAAFAVALWLGARVIRRGLTWRTGVGLCGAAAIAILAKATGYALVPAVLLALAVGTWRVGAVSRLRDLAGAALPLLALAVPVLAWVGFARLSDRPAVNQVGPGVDGIDHAGPLSYLWQFYLPHLPGQQPLPAGFPPLPAIDFWLEGGWGKFGWLEVELPSGVYVALAALTVALVAGGVTALVRAGVRRHALTAAFFALVALALLAGLHATEYRLLSTGAGSFNQGRYLLPLLPLLGVAAAASVRMLGGRWRPLCAGALVGALLALQVLSLAIVGGRFYV